MAKNDIKQKYILTNKVKQRLSQNGNFVTINNFAVISKSHRAMYSPAVVPPAPSSTGLYDTGLYDTSLYG